MLPQVGGRHCRCRLRDDGGLWSRDNPLAGKVQDGSGRVGVEQPGHFKGLRMRILRVGRRTWQQPLRVPAWSSLSSGLGGCGTLICESGCLFKWYQGRRPQNRSSLMMRPYREVAPLYNTETCEIGNAREA